MPTLNLGLPYLAAAQAQKHVTHNDALDLADALINLSVLSRTVSAPPAVITDGTRYLLPINPTGYYAGHGGKIAIYLNSGWRYVTPKIGWLAYIVDEAVFVSFNGTIWIPFQAGGSGSIPTQLQNLTGLGIGTVSNTSNPLSAQINNALFTALPAAYGGTGDLRFTLNKNTVSNTVSQLYQTNYSGRAETGLTGDDHFHIKVSPDGQTWKEALDIDPVNGQITLKYGLSNLYGGFRNRLINGNFDIWQAGTNFNLTGTQVQSIADEWIGINSAGVSANYTKVAAPAGFRGQNALNMTAMSCAVNDKISFGQKIRGQMLADIDNAAASLSFDLKASTNAGSLSGSILLFGNTAFDNDTFSVPLDSIAFNVSSSSAIISVPIPATSTAGFKLGAKLVIQFTQASATGNVNITLGAVQLEKGTVVNPFEFRPTAIETSLYQASSAGVSSGSTVSSIPFSTIIPFTQALAQYMPQQKVSGPLSLSPGINPVQGSSVYLRLIADGVNTPIFGGFTEWGGSLGYSNMADTVNIIQFFYDGVQAFYCVTQAIQVQGAPSGLSLSGSSSGNSGITSGPFTVSLLPTGSLVPTVPITVTPSSTIPGTFAPVSLTLSNTVIAGTFTFTPSGSGVASINLSNNAGLSNPAAFSYTVANAPAYTAITLTGPTSGVKGMASGAFTATLSPAGSLMPAITIVTPTSSGGTFTPASLMLTPTVPSGTFSFTAADSGAASILVTNNQGLSNPVSLTYIAAAASSYIHFSPIRTMVQSGTGPYTYTSAGGSYGGAEAIAKSSVGFQNGVDGSITLAMTVANNGDNITILWGVCTLDTIINAYGGLAYGLWNHGSGYQPFVNGSGDVASPVIIPNIGDYMKVTRTGSVLTWSISQNSGSTWVVIKSYTNVTTAALNIYALANTGGAFMPISATGLV